MALNDAVKQSERRLQKRSEAKCQGLPAKLTRKTKARSAIDYKKIHIIRQVINIQEKSNVFSVFRETVDSLISRKNLPSSLKAKLHTMK